MCIQWRSLHLIDKIEEKVEWFEERTGYQQESPVIRSRHQSTPPNDPTYSQQMQPQDMDNAILPFYWNIYFGYMMFLLRQ